MFIYNICSPSCTIVDNLRSLESIASVSSRPGLLYWCSVCGHLSRQVHYLWQTTWRDTAHIHVRKDWTLSYARTKCSVSQKNCRLTHGWPVQHHIPSNRCMYLVCVFMHMYRCVCVCLPESSKASWYTVYYVHIANVFTEATIRGMGTSWCHWQASL